MSATSVHRNSSQTNHGVPQERKEQKKEKRALFASRGGTSGHERRVSLTSRKSSNSSSSFSANSRARRDSAKKDISRKRARLDELPVKDVAKTLRCKKQSLANHSERFFFCFGVSLQASRGVFRAAMADPCAAGKKFIESMGKWDFDGVQSVLADDVTFRIILPAPVGFRECQGALDTADYFRGWFGSRKLEKTQSFNGAPYPFLATTRVKLVESRVGQPIGDRVFMEFVS